MIKLRALTRHLIERRVVAPEQLDSWAEQVAIDMIWKPDLDGLHMSDMRYSAVVVIERFAGDPTRLVALLATWLEAHDRERDDENLPAPKFDIDILDDDLADVTIALEFIEPQYLAEDPTGEFEAFGKTWAFVPFDLWVAEHGEVGQA